MRILQKFYAPTEGRIYVNGILLENYQTSRWREAVGVVPQEITLFQGTLLENITLIPNEDDEPGIRRRCIEVGLNAYLESLPFGYKTLVGEGGINLSGGQIQLIGLARALYGHPKLLLLDEASSWVDRGTEKHLFQILQNLKEQMAIIIVAHQTQNPVGADRTYEINNGKSLLIQPFDSFRPMP